ncbi:MAG: hypothetical protein DRO87_07420 [Candidatus Thorarchaeota archaeon]|nr:MAG: hypothetical protein DRO87_07420 [Candidatus Thorarchaeota archaeon]RLI57147.1 MAG: hypothetical protein DRP09_03865 [Candidatus Thorarchaeota archaeon]
MRIQAEGFEQMDLSLDWSKAKLVPVVAEEKVHFGEGETNLVKIRPIDIPAKGVPITSFYGVNGMGHVSCIGSLEYKSPDEDRVADVAMFQSRIKASVMKGDLLALTLVVPSK